MRKVLDFSKYKLSAQDRSYHLFTLPSKKFLIKPDIVVKRKVDDAVFICDTKWKILSDTKANHGISQSDMYQMYAYQKKYSAKHITLIIWRNSFERMMSKMILKILMISLIVGFIFKSQGLLAIGKRLVKIKSIKPALK